MNHSSDTIVAQATAAGRAGIGVIRVAGPLVPQIARQLLGELPLPRAATRRAFKNLAGEVLDDGIALFFPQPHSYTGDDILELQGHGSPVVLDWLLQTIIELGARLAEPGEFSRRAFLNGKLDLAQTEAVADLINAGSIQAARSALRSLQGDFSNQVNELLKKLTHLRGFIEAAIDFPEEEIDFLGESQVGQDLVQLVQQLQTIQQSAQQGALLRDGAQVIIMGEPNVGKSSLLNSLSGQERAIVTDIAGTTRDLLHETIQIEGMPLHIIDTAGLRDSLDPIEQEGIRRAQAALELADVLLYLVDASQTQPPALPDFLKELTIPHLIIYNKIDLTAQSPQLIPDSTIPHRVTLFLSAKYQQGIDLLRQQLKTIMGYRGNETLFIARRRHLEVLTRTQDHITQSLIEFTHHRGAELVAEQLRLAQQTLGEITGEFTSDDLLGKIFSEFCIGK